MALIHEVDFNAWLDAEFEIDRGAEVPSFGCTSCGAAPERYEFIGEYCIICLVFQYGRFVKAQEIAVWVDRHAWLFQPGQINRKARAIEEIGTEDFVRHTHESDEE